MPTLPDNSEQTPAQLCASPASSTGACPSHASVNSFTVAGLPPDEPTQYPAVILWTDWHTPRRSPYAAWPPQTPPPYGNSVWTFNDKGWLCIATTIESREQFYPFVFMHWGCRPCGQSKVSNTREADGGKYVIEDSAL